MRMPSGRSCPDGCGDMSRYGGQPPDNFMLWGEGHIKNYNHGNKTIQRKAA